MFHLGLFAGIAFLVAVAGLFANGRPGGAFALLGAGGLLFTPAGWFLVGGWLIATAPAEPPLPPLPHRALSEQEFLCWPATPPCAAQANR
ncbi:MAG TPA: hypothetical protein VGF39_03940 [Stellaceae bacterium]|jgi:hypothetical protein